MAVEAVCWSNLGDDTFMEWNPASRRSGITLMVASIAVILLAVAFLTYLAVLAADHTVLFFYELIGVRNLYTMAAPAESFLVTNLANGNVFSSGLAMVGYLPCPGFMGYRHEVKSFWMASTASSRRQCGFGKAMTAETAVHIDKASVSRESAVADAVVASCTVDAFLKVDIMVHNKRPARGDNSFRRMAF